MKKSVLAAWRSFEQLKQIEGWKAALEEYDDQEKEKEKVGTEELFKSLKEIKPKKRRIKKKHK